MAELEFETPHPGVALIRINRPEALGAFTYTMIDRWVELIDQCARDASIRAVVVTGTGRGFCTGTDTKAMQARGAEGAWDRKQRLHERVQSLPRALQDFDKPYIAAINGLAFGAGLDLALMADIRFVARSARMAESYVRAGIIAGDGGTWYLPRLIGTARALDLLWTGRTIEPEEAERIGLVNAVLDDDRLLDHALDYAQRIASGPPLAIRMMKRAVYQGLEHDLRTSLDLISSHTAVLGTTEDSLEAVRALNEKRVANFRGS